eukprot:s406_g8.t1
MERMTKKYQEIAENLMDLRITWQNKRKERLRFKQERGWLILHDYLANKDLAWTNWLDQKDEHEKHILELNFYNVHLGILVATELFPSMKPFTILHKIIPGREKEPPSRGPKIQRSVWHHVPAHWELQSDAQQYVIPSVFYLGPLSAWSMGTRVPQIHIDRPEAQKNRDVYCCPDKSETAKGSIARVAGWVGDTIDELYFSYWPEQKMSGPVQERDLIERSMGNDFHADEVKYQWLPPFTCGLQIDYHHGGQLSQIAFINFKSESISVRGKHASSKQFHRHVTLGPSLCQMYTLDKVAQLAQSVGGGLLSSEGPVLLARRVVFGAGSISCGRFSWWAQCFVKILHVLAQPVGLLSLWPGANLDVPRAAFLALCAYRIALVVALAENPRHFVPVGSLSLWRGANLDVARATLSALCASLWRAANLRAFVQPARHFVPVGSLSLRRNANFDIARATISALCACRVALAVALFLVDSLRTW